MNDVNTLVSNPPKEFRPLVRWWWPGLDVDAGELVKEIDALDGQGFGGVEVQVFLIGSPSPNEESKHRFAPHPYYYDIVEVVLEAASSRDMVVDLTISSSWPPGGTWVTKDDSLKTLLMGSFIVKGPATISQSLPPLKPTGFYGLPKSIKKLIGNLVPAFEPADFTRLATVAAKPLKGTSTKMNYMRPKARLVEFSSAIDISSRVDAQGTITWDVPGGTWQVFTIYQGPSGMVPLSAANSKPGERSLVVDMFNKDALARFMDGHLGPARSRFKPYAGKTLRALFTDSQEIAAEWFWTPGLIDEFEKRRGYDVRPYLPACSVPHRDNQFTHVVFQNEKPYFDFPGGIGARIRHDWEETISDLFAENYCGGIAGIAGKDGIKHRIQAYGIRVDLLKAYGRADIPETEQLFAGGSMDFLRVAGSAGIAYKKPVVSCESVVWMGRDYMTTPFKIKVAADRLFVAGINQIIYHGFPYHAPWKDFPGHYPWSPPCFSSNLNMNNPFWPFFKEINAYVTRAQCLLRQGKTRCNVAVYYPHWNYDYKYLMKEDLGGGYLEGFDGDPPRGPVIWYMTHPRSRIDKTTHAYHRLGAALTRRGYFYMHVNNELLLNSTLENGKLVIGDARIDAVIFPNITEIPLDVASKVHELQAQGIHVIFYGTVPDRQPGFFNHEENDAKVKALFAPPAKGCIHVLKANQDVGLYLWNLMNVFPTIELTKPDDSLQFICKETVHGNLYFLRSTSSGHGMHVVGFRELGKVPLVVDLWNGTVTVAPQYHEPRSFDDAKFRLSESLGRVTMILYLEPHGSRMILFAPAGDAEPASHVLESTLEAFRSGNSFVSYADKNGTFRCILGDGQELAGDQLVPPPPSIPLTDWDLVVKHRRASGEVIDVVQHHVKPEDWRKNKRLKYCSGPGHYSTVLTLPDDYFTGCRLLLSLGRVHDVATVTVNGTVVKTLLIPPYDVDITALVKRNETNTIEVDVTGTMRNMLVGYGKKHGKPWKHHKRQGTMPMGIIGPACIKAQHVVRYSKNN